MDVILRGFMESEGTYTNIPMLCSLEKLRWSFATIFASLFIGRSTTLASLNILFDLCMKAELNTKPAFSVSDHNRGMVMNQLLVFPIINRGMDTPILRW